MKLLIHFSLLINVGLLCLSSCQGKELLPEEKQYQRIWEGDVIYNEPVVMIEHDDGYYGELLYIPSKIISVKNSTLEYDYLDSDYHIEGRRVYRNENSSFPFLTRNNINCVELPDNIGTYHDGNGGILLFTETDALVKYQVMFTYEHNDKWEDSIPQKNGNGLPRLQEKLQSKENINMVVYGDSIFTGLNASIRLGVPPYQDTFADGFAKEIERVYGSKVEVTNTSKSATTSEWGAKNVQERVPHYNPDLVLVGFGMNDGSGAIPGSEYINNIEIIVKEIKEKCSNADIILTGSIIANPDSGFNRGQKEYLPLLYDLSKQYDNTIVLDMTTFSNDVLKYKSSFEFFANNINHPCDFVVRSYVANLMNIVEVE